jgi:BatD DUF11 like domain
VISLLLVLTLVQGSGPSLEATVDEERVSVGEDLLYTLRAVSHSPLPMHVSIAPFTGLEIVSRSERSEVSMGHDPTRTTVLEVRLRAVRPGRWQVGPARAVQSRDTVEAPAVVVDVTASRAATASTLGPRLRRLLDQARPPVAGEAAVDLIVSADSVRVGEQVDVVTAAWFPRDLRLQLRRPPTLQPPVIDGVWSYPQATPAGIAATRSIGGRWYDLFVAHQVVFPLLPGTVIVPRATLKYSTPVALQFFSQEERYALGSKAETLAVAALPEPGRPVGFSGAIGTGLTLERRVSPRVARVGEGVMVELALSGEGNTALWPAPDLQWAPGARAYSDKVEERVGVSDGRVGGTKTFRYLVVPDSAGALSLPAVSYPYFDLAGARYLSAALPATAIPVSPGGSATTSTALPPPLMRPVGPGLDWRLGRALPDWVWLLVLIAPPRCELGSPCRGDERRRCPWETSEAPKKSSRPSCARWCPTRSAAQGPVSRPPCGRPVPIPRSRPGSRPCGSGSWPDDTRRGREGRRTRRSPARPETSPGDSAARSAAGMAAAWRLYPSRSRCGPRGCWRRRRRPRPCTSRARSPPRPRNSRTGPSASPPWPRTGTISARPTIGWARMDGRAGPGCRPAASPPAPAPWHRRSA